MTRIELQDLFTIGLDERVASYGWVRTTTMSLTPEGFGRMKNQESDREGDRKEDVAQRLVDARYSFVGCARERVM
jgi:hypothetical protein